MPNHELHRTLQGLGSVQFPLNLQVKLLRRYCVEQMESEIVVFLGAWRCWEIDEDVDHDDFYPLQPALRPLVNSLADKSTQLEMDANDGDAEMDEKFKDKKDALALEWKAQVVFFVILSKIPSRFETLDTLHSTFLEFYSPELI